MHGPQKRSTCKIQKIKIIQQNKAYGKCNCMNHFKPIKAYLPLSSIISL